MKAETYARLSLLIPILMWGFCLVLVFLGYLLFPDSQSMNESLTPMLVIAAFALFYVIGIIFWFVPYLLLALFLFLLSLKINVESLKLVYLLSPFAMAALMMVVTVFMTVSPPEGSLLSSDLVSDWQDSMGTGALFALVTLIWGYVCVGMGFGMYKLLQHYGMIHDGLKPAPQPTLLEA